MDDDLTIHAQNRVHPPGARKWMAFALLAGGIWQSDAQTLVDLTRQGKLSTGTLLPAQCTVGQLFFKTDAARGANLYGCTAQGQWSAEAGAAGNMIWSGSNPPAGTVGADGDFYLLNPATAPCLYGPKAGGAWPGNCTRLAAAAGNTGDLQKNAGGTLAPAVAGIDYQPPPSTLTTGGANPVCDIGVAANVSRCEQTLSANTLASFQHLKAGAKFTWSWTQPASGGPYTVTYGGAANVCAVSPAPGATTVQLFEVQADGVTVFGVGCSTSEALAIWRGPTGPAPATPSSGLACWFDGTANNWLCKDAGANVYAATRTIPANPGDHRYVSYIDGNGVQQRTQPTASDVLGLAASATTDTTSAANISAGTLADQRLSANVELLNAAQTVPGSRVYTGRQDFSAAAGTLPAQSGKVTNLPGSCAVGQVFFATDAAPGANLYLCTAAGVWTQVQSGGGGGGGVSAGSTLPATCSTGSVFALATTYASPGSFIYYPGIYTCVAANVWASGASMLTSGTGALWPPFGGMPQSYPGTSAPLGASNVMQCVQFNQPATFRAATFRTNVVAGDAGKTFGVNFYDVAGNLLGPGTTAGASVSTAGFVSGSIGLTMGPGAYTMCAASDSNSILKVPMNNDGNAIAVSIAYYDTTKRFFTCANHTSMSGGTITWPSSCGAVSPIAGGSYPPWVLITN